MKLGITFYFAEEAGVLVVEDGGPTPFLPKDVIVGCSWKQMEDVDRDSTYMAPFLSTDQATLLLQSARTFIFYREATLYAVERDANNVWKGPQFIVEHENKEGQNK